MAFEMKDYVDVAERVQAFYAKYPEGSIQSEITELTDTRVVVKAWAYRTPDDVYPAIGHSALGIPGTTPYTRGSEIENAETSAWGRALAALGFGTKHIASRDEVQAKQRPAHYCEQHDTELKRSRSGKWGHVLPDGTACVEDK